MGYLQRREMRMRDTNGEWVGPCLISTVCYPSPPSLSSLAGEWARIDQSNGCAHLFLESTNERVKNFSILILIGIVALGIWQVSRAQGPCIAMTDTPQLIHLRSFFKRKYLID